MTTSKSIAVIDVGLGNIGSIERMIQKVGGKAVTLQTPSQLQDYSKILLPGVGHFDEGITRLTDIGFTQTIINLVNSKNIYILGICLGMQMLCRRSEEGQLPGLGLIDADVKKFQFPARSCLKVPHMGWNVVNSTVPNLLLPLSEIEQRFYFVHSYRVVPDHFSDVIGTSNHGDSFCAAFQKKRIYGVQFHPEKSHRFGMELMHRYINL
ncbi:imidazole glycerol phosphate synthase subunit HisH [Synechococcus sp. MIT S9504]|uniref:imidazole glycerol phosphate synthase subunit HisH n=1 Tax=Synechococcus sp. MIT S9504 TaxID=1801628 RepID=UPI0007BC7F06|nr:imidazole glycerol phosphate synthase subunit HisH [Synechococcus sp. MIT S9504]KZR84999.1 Imidazole glycerol phosphate synthase subunit HisH 1 [Synechococcus sp. MIT S9504]